MTNMMDLRGLVKKIPTPINARDDRLCRRAADGDGSGRGGMTYK
ncbi:MULTISPECIES: hypothetical protein [Mesorhizobium]|nr:MULTISPECIES: hypothetical protein [Mesorhizobium]